MNSVEIKNLKFKYKNDSPLVLNIPSLVIQGGERVFLFGPSGSGKSTLLEILAGVLNTPVGEVQILGQNFSQFSAHQKDLFRSENVGYIFQSFNLIPYLSVRENIELPLHLSPARRAKVKSIIDEMNQICEKLGILELLNKKTLELSVGQQQRVAAARALMGSPKLILADEPTSALDYDHREKFIKLLFDVCDLHQATLLFVSHDRSLKDLFSRHLSLTEVNKA